MVNTGHEILKETSNFLAKNHAFTYLCVYTQTQRANTLLGFTCDYENQASIHSSCHVCTSWPMYMLNTHLMDRELE